jgi:AraC-like DNA-binding protein
MIELNFNTSNYSTLLEQIAQSLKCSIKESTILLPPIFGEGWFWAETLPSGMSILVSDAKLSQEIIFNKPALTDQFFSLEFSELYTTNKKGGVHKEILFQSFAVLHQTSNPLNFSIPAFTRVKSVKIYFSLKQLAQLINSESIELLFTKDIMDYLATELPKIIDAQYRTILDDLIVPQIMHPLKLNFIQNRILLLFEKFIQKRLKANILSSKNKLNSSELERLMQVENILLQDYALAPPTIEKLSKICAMSATKLKSEFRNLYGAPIYEYYQKNRMAKAKSLLLDGNYTSKEVGLLIGYSNLSHFAAAFKKEYGVSPSDLLSKHLDIRN